MPTIEKAPETMTSRRRVEKTLNFEKTDRVPIDYTTNPGVHERVKQALGAADDEALRQALGVDFRSVHADYRGPNRFPVLPNRQTDPVYGYNMRWGGKPLRRILGFLRFPAAGRRPGNDRFLSGAQRRLNCYSHIGEYIQANRVTPFMPETPACAISSTLLAALWAWKIRL